MKTDAVHSRREFLWRAGLGAALLAPWSRLLAAGAASAGGAPVAKPNFIVIYMDDMGYGDVAPFGSKKNRTPHLDRMAAEGTRFTSFYAAPLCTASRTTLMTGCYAKRCGMPAVLFPVSGVGLSRREKIIPELLKPQGYATMCIGKWHLGDQPEYLPTRRGFDHYLGLPYSNDMGSSERPPAKKAANAKPASKRPPLPLLRDEKVIQEVAPKDQDRLVQIYTEEAVAFIKANKDRPFFLYLPHTAVHNPHHPGEAFKGKSANGVYGDWVEESDWSVGQVLDTVRSLGLAARTLVLFTSDNGGTKTGDNGPLRGFKGSTWEGGVREPTIAWWPGRVPAGRTCDEIACTMDVLPTLVHLGGGEVPADRAIDGRDIRPLLLGEPGAKTPHEAFYYFATGVGNLDAVRSGPWKYRLQPEKALYDLDKDIGETTDVAAANPDVVKRMQELVEKMDKDLGATGRGPGCRDHDTVASPKPLVLSGAEPASK
ncbi:MAG: sulfatase [Planctomycetes bacterium]|nr:sulfatase [Planctomycetota bacterium]